MTDYVELPSDALLDHEQPANTQDGVTYTKDASGRLIVDVPGASPDDQATTGPRDLTAKDISPDYQDLPQGAQLDGQQDQPSTLSQVVSAQGGALRDIAGGAGQFLNLATSPIKAVLNAVGLPGGDTDYEHVADHIADQLGLPKTAPVQQAIQRGIISGLITGGAAAPVAAAAPAESAAATIAKSLASAPLTDAVSQGTGAGAGEATKQAGGGTAAQIAASLLAGGATAAGGARLAAPRVAASPTEAGQLYEAAQRQGIDPLPADVGGPATRRLTSAAAQAPISASPVINAAKNMQNQAQSARDRIASAVGEALDPEAAGDQARSGAVSYINSSRAEKNAAYDVAEKAAAGTQVVPTRALDVLDRNIAELNDTVGGAPAMARLQGLRDELARRGTVSVAGLRNTRTVLRQEFIKDGLRGSDTERRVNQVLDAAKDDIIDSLKADGKANAANLYAKADALNSQRSKTIDGILLPLIGTVDRPKSGEQIIKSLTADLQGNNARAVKFLNALPPQEQANTRASIIGALGRSSAGAQNAHGDAFSLSKFLTDWNKIGKTAKRAYFGSEAMSALDDLATVAQGSKEAASYANRSNSSGGIWGNLGVLSSAPASIGALTAGSPGATAGAILGTVGLGSQFIGGRLLASPRFARWLARSAKTTLSPPAYVDRLTRIAAVEPSLSGDILHLRDRLHQAFQQPALAAKPDQQEANGGRDGRGQQ